MVWVEAYLFRVWVEAYLFMVFFIVCLCMYCYWRTRYKEGGVGIPLTGLNPPHFCVCSTPGPGFPTSYVVFFVFSEFS
jgi:hypothetical protein